MSFGKSTENYYDTLKLSSNCSPKEIRESFIKLSKKYHPDKNKDCPEAHKNFVKISEAYEVLSKNRKSYDDFLRSKAFTPRADFQQRSPGFETESPYEQWLRHGGPERKYSEFYQFHHGQKKHQYRPPPFTKIDPRQKYKVLAGVCALLAIGIIGHVFAITRISAYRQNQARKRSEIYAIMYKHGKKLERENAIDITKSYLDRNIKHMTLAEATAEYERRHNLRDDKK